MSFFMVLTFIMYWAPMQMITLYRFYDDTFVSRSYFGWLFFLSHWLAVSRSFVNPFIYACNNQRFRKGFAYFLFFHFLYVSPKRYQSTTVANSMSSRLNIPLALISKSQEPTKKIVKQRNGSLNRGRSNNYSFRSVNLISESAFSRNSSRLMSITALNEPSQIDTIKSPLKFLKPNKES